MSNTQKKQAKRKARQKEKPKRLNPTHLSPEWLAREMGCSVQEARDALSELQGHGLINVDSRGRGALSKSSQISMAVHEATGVYVAPSEVEATLEMIIDADSPEV